MLDIAVLYFVVDSEAGVTVVSIWIWDKDLANKCLKIYESHSLYS